MNEPFRFDPAVPTVDVARALLGANLHAVADDGTTVAGRVVETEAYLGLRDPACHSFHGRRTPRVTSMYLSAGHAYVYRSYGVHWCLNVVTGPPDAPEAVLLRALAPVSGLAAMRARRGSARADHELARGPGNLTRALGLDARHDGVALAGPPLWLEPGPAPLGVGCGPRVGLGAQNPARDWPLRFWVVGERAVSGRRR